MTTIIDFTLTLTVGILIGVAVTRWWAHNNLVYHLDLYREMIEAEMETGARCGPRWRRYWRKDGERSEPMAEARKND